VEAEAGDAGTAGTGQYPSIISIDPVSAGLDPLSGVGAGRDSAQNRRAVEIRQQRPILRERIGLFGIALRAQAATFEQGRNPVSKIGGNGSNIGVFRRQQRVNSTLQERSQFAFDKSRNVPVPLLLHREESLQLFCDNGIQNGAFRLTGPVLGFDAHGWESEREGKPPASGQPPFH
jgi:hypothetical protein